MSVQAAPILDAANTIAQQCGQADPITRAVVSRAYYACYHHALAAAKANGFDSRDAIEGLGSHARLIKFLKAHATEGLLRQYGTRLEKLRDQRTHADYDLDKPLVSSCTQVLTSAASFIQLGKQPPQARAN